MTREEVIEILKDGELNPCVTEDREACDMAIKALEQEPCEDTISRQAAIDAIEHRLAEPAYQHTGEDWYVGMNCAESELYELPSAQPEIIRCRDCKHRTSYWGNCKLLEEKYHQTVRVGCDEFCSMAERRTDD